MQKTKAKQTKTSNKGITLVALVITVIVLLILAAVGIGAIAGPEGLIAKAKQAAEGYNDAAHEEAQTINEIFNMINGGNQGGSEEPEQPILNAEGNVNFTYNPSTPTNENVKVGISTETGYNIKYSIGNAEGEYQYYTGEITVEENTAIYVKLENSNKETGEYATGNVANIDKVEPNEFTPKIIGGTENSITISAKTEDTGSEGCATENIGIVEYTYYVNGEPKYTGPEESTTISGIPSNLSTGKKNNIYVIAKDKAGNTRTSEEIAETYVGYYISTDNDNEPDGIIYGDRLHPASGEWGNDYGGGAYTIDEIEQAKEYYICANGYEGAFGTADVIKAVNKEEKEGKRFYVMALENVASGTYTWGNDYELSEIITSLEVGSGAENTKNMIAELGNGTTGTNLWEIEQLQNKVAEGWYVPSRAEWAAFADAFDITNDSSSPNHYVNFGLGNHYWSSSQATTDIAWDVGFNDGDMYYFSVDYSSVSSYYCVRLGGTF